MNGKKGTVETNLTTRSKWRNTKVKMKVGWEEIIFSYHWNINKNDNITVIII